MLTTAEKVAFWLGQPVTIEIGDPYVGSMKWLAECRPYAGDMIEVTWTIAWTEADGQALMSSTAGATEWFSKEELLSMHTGAVWWVEPLLELFPEDD